MTSTPTTRASLLLRLCDSQDHEAWVEFVTLYEPVVYRLLRQNGLQDADARDVMQELFLTVSRNVDRWDPAKDRGSFRGWLRRRRSQPGHQLAEASRAAQSWRPVVPTCLRCSTCLPAAGEAETAEFDRELERALFHRAGEQVRGEVHPANLASLLGNQHGRTFGDRRSGEARHDGRGSADGQVPRVGPPAGGRVRNGGTT